MKPGRSLMMTIEILKEEDIVHSRQSARDLAKELGFSMINITRIATAVSELARNVFQHGGGGYMEISKMEKAGRVGLCCIFIDKGPGIRNIAEAMTDGFSTGQGLGHGLPGSRRLMDDLEIESETGKGTRIEIMKWK